MQGVTVIGGTGGELTGPRPTVRRRGGGATSTRQRPTGRLGQRIDDVSSDDGNGNSDGGDAKV